MNPLNEPATEGQFGKVLELFGARLRKSNLKGKPLQAVIENQGAALVGQLMAKLTEMVDAVSELISRTVTVNRKRSGKEALTATGRKLYVTDSVVADMPNGEGGEVEVFFFKPDLTSRKGSISDDDLDKEYELRGLEPADPYALAAANEADPAFADKYPNGTHWKDADGNWCFATFDRWVGDERNVNVNRDDLVWHDHWWFAGVRKKK